MSEQKPEKISQATELVHLFQAVDDAVAWHDEIGNQWATLPIGGRLENVRIGSKGFRRWLQLIYFQTYEKNPHSQAVQDALTTIEGFAQFKGEQHQVFIRIGEHESTIYLDLCDEQWRVVEITSAGWTVIDSAAVPIKFRRARGMMPLPLPIRGGKIGALRPFLNVGNDADWILVVGWLIGAMRRRGPFPVLECDGEQGSAKSTAQRAMRRIIDPNEADLRSQPRDERDLVLAANNGWAIGLDNLSYCPPQISDALCRISTGGGFATRELYTDSEEVIFAGSRPILLNGINEIATRSDLLDRTIRVILPTIDEDRRRPERAFWLEFEAARPGILGALLDAVAVALRNEPTVKIDRLPRMADFARWVVAAEPSLPWKPGAFLAAYAGNREAAHELALEASPVVGAFRRFVEFQGGTWTGKAADLLAHLEHHNFNGADTRPEGWPKRPHNLSHALRRLAPNLRAVGIDVQFNVDGERGIRVRQSNGNEDGDDSDLWESQAIRSVEAEPKRQMGHRIVGKWSRDRKR